MNFSVLMLNPGSSQDDIMNYCDIAYQTIIDTSAASTQGVMITALIVGFLFGGFVVWSVMK